MLTMVSQQQSEDYCMIPEHYQSKTTENYNKKLKKKEKELSHL